MKKIIVLFLAFSTLIGCSTTSKEEKQLALNITNNKSFSLVKEKAKDIISTGFTAGDGYGEVWIRDFNTFMELSLDVNDKQIVLDKLLIFF